MKSKSAFKLALVQMRVEGGNRTRNLQHAEALIATAAAQGAELVLLPEAMDLGWTHPACETQAGPIPGGETFQKLSAAAQAHQVFVCAGLVEQAAGAVFNSAVIIDRNGRLLLLHRKLNELDIGHRYYGPGDRLNVCHTELGTLGLMICADAAAQDRVLARALGYMGADVILSPSAWAVPADHDNVKKPYGKMWNDAYIPVARDFAVWIAGVSNVGWLTAGPWQGWQCIGCSLVVGPEGRAVLKGPYGVDAETILYIDVSPVPRPARGTDWGEYWKKKAKNK